MDEGGLGRGVVVLGMHRSGTSAVTGVIDALGLPACRQEDRMPARRWNARGNYESRSLTQFDERLLNSLGGAWYAPPDLPEGWAADPRLARHREEAAMLFAAAHPSRHWVWKDPRASLLMPFWDTVFGARQPRIIVLRNPLESASSLASRNRMSLELALALAERSLRCALRDSASRPVLVTAYDELFDDIEGWCSAAAAFMSANGISLPGALRMDAARAFVDPSLRHHREAAPTPSDGVPHGLARLCAWARERLGPHSSLSIQELPDESPGVALILRAAR